MNKSYFKTRKLILRIFFILFILLIIFLLQLPIFINLTCTDYLEDEKIRNLYSNKDLTTYPLASSNWVKNGTDLTPIVNEQKNIESVSDGNGGAYIIWLDEVIFGDRDIYMQRIDNKGDTCWPGIGIAISNQSREEYQFDIAVDKNNDAIVVWRDENGVNGLNIKIQKIDSDGNLLWGTYGKDICNATGTQAKPQIIVDEMGGYVAAWQDLRDGNSDLYAQRVDSNGNGMWDANGTAICTVLGNCQDFTLYSIVDQYIGLTWQDLRNDTGDIYAQMLDRFGNSQWTTNGTIICNQSGMQYSPIVKFDGIDGIIILWRDYRNGNSDIYMQRIAQNEKIIWDLNGTRIETLSTDSIYIRMITDNEGEIIIVWSDDRNDNLDIYAQKISASKKISWKENGTLIAGGHIDQYINDIIVDDNDVLCLINNKITHSDHYFSFQKIDEYGNRIWGSNGSIFINKLNSRGNGKLVPNKSHGFHVFWEEIESTLKTDLFYHYFDGIPLSSSPNDIITDKYSCETIEWNIDDNFNEGFYQIFRNDSNGNEELVQSWTSYHIDIPIEVDINRTLPGEYIYRINYYEDDKGMYGLDDIVSVTILDHEPCCSGPEKISCYKGFSTMIYWKLSDDYGPGQYRILVNETNTTYYIYSDWNPWINNSFIITPINSSLLGTFNYTIEYTTSLGQFNSKSVIVSILEEANPNTENSEDTQNSNMKLWQEILLYLLAVSTILLIIFNFVSQRRTYKIIRQFESQTLLPKQKDESHLKQNNENQEKINKKTSDIEKTELNKESNTINKPNKPNKAQTDDKIKDKKKKAQVPNDL